MELLKLQASALECWKFLLKRNHGSAFAVRDVRDLQMGNWIASAHCWDIVEAPPVTTLGWHASRPKDLNSLCCRQVQLDYPACGHHDRGCHAESVAQACLQKVACSNGSALAVCCLSSAFRCCIGSGAGQVQCAELSTLPGQSLAPSHDGLKADNTFLLLRKSKALSIPVCMRDFVSMNEGHQGKIAEINLELKCNRAHELSGGSCASSN